jgi:hypothetical protein
MLENKCWTCMLENKCWTCKDAQKPSSHLVCRRKTAAIEMKLDSALNMNTSWLLNY